MSARKELNNGPVEGAISGGGTLDERMADSNEVFPPQDGMWFTFKCVCGYNRDQREPVTWLEVSRLRRIHEGHGPRYTVGEAKRPA